jgi:multidrug resistance protein, MATE family
VPTNVILIVAPINAFLNWLLGTSLSKNTIVERWNPNRNNRLVLGPEPFRLGFIGAPIAAALSMNLISVASVGYGIFFAPRTAWHPLSLRAFQNLGLLVRLGIAGVGQTASEWWSWELVGRECSRCASLFDYMLINSLYSCCQLVCLNTYHKFPRFSHLSIIRLGPVSLATQSVLLVSCSTTYQVPFALSVATSVRCVNLIILTSRNNCSRFFLVFVTYDLCLQYRQSSWRE